MPSSFALGSVVDLGWHYWLVQRRVFRTMVAELVPSKEHHARAFTIMPMIFNIGSGLGPFIGWL